jgi:hypothetical protein
MLSGKIARRCRAVAPGCVEIEMLSSAIDVVPSL